MNDTMGRLNLHHIILICLPTILFQQCVQYVLDQEKVSHTIGDNKNTSCYYDPYLSLKYFLHYGLLLCEWRCTSGRFVILSSVCFVTFSC